MFLVCFENENFSIMEDPVDSLGALFRFIAHYQQKEFVGQKAISQDIEEQVYGDSCAEVLALIWAKAKTMIKREILVDDGDKFNWAENENPEQDEIGNFVIFQDKSAKKNYSVSQMNSDVMTKMRDKHVNVMVHVYGKAIASKPIHQKMTAAILQPADRDRAGAHSTVLLTELSQKLKGIHGSYLSGHMSSWTMWANSIHAAPTHKQAAMVNDMPPSHLVHLFRSVPTSETEVLRSAQNGLQIAGNLNDMYAENVKIMREEFLKMKETTLRGFELFEVRLNATEEMLTANNRLVDSMDCALRVEVNAVNLEEEQQITDMPDYDHN